MINYIIIIRPYKPDDEEDCKELFISAVESNKRNVFQAIMLNNTNFLMMLLFVVLMFFLGVPFIICSFVIPAIFTFGHISMQLITATKMERIQQEDISRTYTSISYSGFWVAEAYQPLCILRNPKELRYSIMTIQEFLTMKSHSSIKLDFQARKIVGTIGLIKSRDLDNNAWLKRLHINQQYTEKGVEECLLKVAIEFAIDQWYDHVKLQLPIYDEETKAICYRMRFQFKQTHHKRVLGSFVTFPMYELTRRTDLD